MEREIKFRAIHNGKFIYGFIQVRKKTDDAVMWTENEQGQMTWLHVDKETIGQFTGLKDKNGVDIYENDIVNSVYFKNAVVVFWKTGWHFEVNKDEHHSLNTAIYSFEIIGNIHNPHKKP